MRNYQTKKTDRLRKILAALLCAGLVFQSISVDAFASEIGGRQTTEAAAEEESQKTEETSKISIHETASEPEASENKASDVVDETKEAEENQSQGTDEASQETSETVFCTETEANEREESTAYEASESETETTETTTETIIEIETETESEMVEDEYVLNGSSDDLNTAVYNKINGYRNDSTFGNGVIWGGTTDGSYSWNGWYQCCGFALHFANTVFGTYPATLRSAADGATYAGWTCIYVTADNCNSLTIEPGDIIDSPSGYNNNGKINHHTAMVLSGSNNNFTCVQCNYRSRDGVYNKIHYGEYFNYNMNRSSLPKLWAVYGGYTDSGSHAMRLWKPSDSLKRGATGSASGSDDTPSTTHGCDSSITVNTPLNGEIVSGTSLDVNLSIYDYHGIKSYSVSLKHSESGEVVRTISDNLDGDESGYSISFSECVMREGKHEINISFECVDGSSHTHTSYFIFSNPDCLDESNRYCGSIEYDSATDEYWAEISGYLYDLHGIGTCVENIYLVADGEEILVRTDTSNSGAALGKYILHGYTFESCGLYKFTLTQTCQSGYIHYYEFYLNYESQDIEPDDTCNVSGTLTCAESSGIIDKKTITLFGEVHDDSGLTAYDIYYRAEDETEEKLYYEKTGLYGEVTDAEFEEYFTFPDYGTYYISLKAKCKNEYVHEIANLVLTYEKGSSTDPGSENSGKVGDISWSLDENGHLTVTGTGDYFEGSNEVPPWTGREDVKTAKVSVTDITSTRQMFYNCRNLASIDLSELDTSNVNDMYGMFSGCTSLESLDLSKFSTRNVENMAFMFDGCTSLKSLEVSSFDTGNVTNMSYMFGDCENLDSLELGSFQTKNVEKMLGMFDGCTSLKSLKVSSFDTGNVTNMSSMFGSCENLDSLELGSFQTGNVTDMSYMFAFCNSLTSIDLGNFDMSGVADRLGVTGMFESCDSLTYIRAPKNCAQNVMLPVSEDTDKWYRENGTEWTECTELPMNLKSSVSLYKNGHPGDGTTKETVFITGITVGDKVYDGKTSPYSGSAVVKDENGNDITARVSLCYSYGGTLADGNAYTASEAAPDKAGSYTLTVKTEDNDTYQGESTYSFCIQRKEVTVTADSVTIDIGAAIPQFTYKTEGLLGGDTFMTEPTLKCDATDTSKAGTYSIVPSGADAGNNYGITYVNGTLLVGVETKSVTVRFDLQGHGVSIPLVTVTVGEKLTAPAEPTAEGYMFGGWYKEAACTNAWNFAEDTVTADMTLYAKWTENMEEETYTVILDLQGHGTQIMPVTVESGNKLTAPAEPTAEGYTFGGWYKEAACTNAWNFAEDTVTANMTLYAKWTQLDRDDSPYTKDERTDLNSVSGAIAKIKATTYDGKPYIPIVKVTVNENGKKKTLTEGTDYRVIYENNVNTGTDGKVIVRGNGIYKGELAASLQINPKSVKKLRIVTGSMTVGSQKEPPIYVYDGTKLLTKDVDYTLEFDSHSLTVQKTNAAKVTVTGKGNYTNFVTAKLAVYEGDASKIINPENVSLSAASVPYTGKAVKTVEPVVVIDGVTLVKNKDYKVSYLNNKNAGTAFVIVTGKGGKNGYKGKVVKSFEITAVTPALTVKAIPAKTYNGQLQKPSLTVWADTKKLTRNRDYTIAYEGNLHAGTAKVTVKGIGNYAAAKQVATFNINPQKISKASVKVVQGRVTLTYSRRTLKEGADYTLQYGEVVGKKTTITVTGKGDFAGTSVKKLKNVQIPDDTSDGDEDDKDTIADGRYENIIWSVSKDGKLTVSGTGEFSAGSGASRAPWYAYRAFVKSAEVVVSGIKDASHMFSGCSGLVSLDFGKSELGNVTNASDMFSGCTGLSEIHAPCHVSVSVTMPVTENMVWYKPDGTTVTELPRDLASSILLTRKQAEEQPDKPDDKEQIVENRLKEVYQELGLDNMSGVDKIGKIYDYVTRNVKYDSTAENRNTIYGALIEGRAVCQGYALLLERMMNDNGISAKYISGIGMVCDGGPDRHAWNIIEYEGLYYNMDATWDSNGSDSTRNYFMKSQTDFEDHVRDDNYNTEEFLMRYPMAKISYGKDGQQLPSYANDEYDFNVAGGGTVSTSTTDDKKIVVLVFGRINCLNTQSFLSALKEKDLCASSKVKIIFGDIDNNDENSVAVFKESYGTDSMYFCYDSGSKISSAAWSYYWKEYSGTSVTLPIVVVIDSRNKVRFIRTYPVSAANVVECIDELIRDQIPAPTLEKAQADAGGNVSLEWTAVDGASKYVIYRCVKEGAQDYKVRETTELSCTDKPAVSGNYFYMVRAVIDGMEGPCSNAMTATVSVH